MYLIDDGGNPMNQQDRDYYGDRADQEREHARLAIAPAIAAIHDALADAYLAKAESPDLEANYEEDAEPFDRTDGGEDSFRQIPQSRQA